MKEPDPLMQPSKFLQRFHTENVGDKVPVYSKQTFFKLLETLLNQSE